jgi:hypothetical protein
MSEISGQNFDSDDELIERTYGKLKDALIYRLGVGYGLSYEELQAYYRETGLILEPDERALLEADMGIPERDIQIAPELLVQYDQDEPHGWLRLAGKEPTEDEIERAKPTEAFVKYVIIDDEEAQRVLDTGRYSVERFVEAMDRMAEESKEDKLIVEELSNLFEFIAQSKRIYPEQFSELLTGLSNGEHPDTRGCVAFVLPLLLEADSKGAVSIWKKLLQDPESPKVVDAAVTTYELQLYPEHRIGPEFKLRHRLALDRQVRAAKTRLENIGYKSFAGT